MIRQMTIKDNGTVCRVQCFQDDVKIIMGTQEVLLDKKEFLNFIALDMPAKPAAKTETAKKADPKPHKKAAVKGDKNE